MPKRKLGFCAYCGNEALLTVDHVVPQGLFIPPLSPDMPKVRACEPCNNQKARSDSYLRDLLVSSASAQRSPIAQQLTSNFRRSVSRHQSDMAKDAAPGHVVNVCTPGGIYLGQANQIYLPTQPIKQALIWIVRGLHHSYLDETVPANARFHAIHVTDAAVVNPLLSEWARRGVAHQMRVADGSVFTCIYAREPEHPETTLWHLTFYKYVVFAVQVSVPEWASGSADTNVCEAAREGGAARG